MFSAELEIIDGTPFVSPPPEELEELFRVAGRDKGPIPIRGSVNDRPYQQTLVRFRGAWRLYINMQMLDDSPRRIGEVIEVTMEFDPADRTIEPHPKLQAALDSNAEARAAFDSLTPSRQKEIVRYIASLKTEESIDRNVARALRFLLGRDGFVGRDRPD